MHFFKTFSMASVLLFFALLPGECISSETQDFIERNTSFLREPFRMKPEVRVEMLLRFKEDPSQYERAVGLLKAVKDNNFEEQLAWELLKRGEGEIALDFYSLLGGNEHLSLNLQAPLFYRWILWVGEPDSYRLPSWACFEGELGASLVLKEGLSALLPGFDLRWDKRKNSHFTFLQLVKKG